MHDTNILVSIPILETHALSLTADLNPELIDSPVLSHSVEFKCKQRPSFIHSAVNLNRDWIQSQLNWE